MWIPFSRSVNYLKERESFQSIYGERQRSVYIKILTRSAQPLTSPLPKQIEEMSGAENCLFPFPWVILLTS